MTDFENEIFCVRNAN